MAQKQIGRVKALFLYPVKSMQALSVSEIDCYWYGANGDRKVAFVRGDILSGFPWLTARELPALLQHAPYFTDPQHPLTSPIRVRTPDGRDLPLEATTLVDELAAHAGEAVSLFKLKRGTFDCMPLSLLTSATLEQVAQAVGRPLDVRRFRPNILVDNPHDTDERAWVNATLAFGAREAAARLQVNYPTKRCVVINLDPEDGQADSRVLKAASASHHAQVGIYASVSRPGTIRVGDTVYIEQQE